MSSNTLMGTPDMIFEAAERFYILSHKHLWAVPFAEHYTRVAALLESTGWKKGNKMTQTDLILKHMRKAGSITQREAYLDYSIQSFHRRLSDLRELGYNIHGVKKRHPTTGQEYTRYYLANDTSPDYVVRKVS